MQFDQWLDSGYWLLLPMMLLCLTAFRKGIVLSVALLMMWQPNDSFAQVSLPDALLNGDQQGERYFTQDPAKAAEHFNDPKWKASSLYKAGDYQGALDIWQQFNDAQSLYNQGNALAQLQQFEQAIEAYDQALSQNPDLEDAKANKALIEQLLKHQQENPQQNQDSSDSQENASKQDGESSDSQQNQSQDGQKQDSQKQDGKDAQSSESQDTGSQEQDGSSANEQNNSENPLEQAQTDAEKQREAEMEKRKQEMAKQRSDQEKSEEELQGESQDFQTQPKSQEDLEQEQAMKQWIQRIPDDPGGLLRNKFLYQYQQRQGNTEQDGERKPW